MKRIRKIAVFCLLFTLVYYGCKEDKTITPASVPDNPYDTIDYGGQVPTDSVDAASFVGLHQYIFSTTCAVPGCHDGSFEPDFRTVQSAYNTLVYHKVVKNDVGNTFEYRVVPGNSSKSWLHYRITTDDKDLGRMPLYDSLTPAEVTLIKNWINDGAKDPYGNSTVVPSTTPTFFGVLAYIDDTTGIRLDTSRESIIDPIILPKNQMVDLWVGLYDQDENGGFLPAFDFTYNKYKISNHLYDFSSSPELSLIVEPAAKPFIGPNPFDPNGKVPYYHHFTINTMDFPTGQTQYYRVYVQDMDSSEPTEIPSDGSPLYFLTLFSFVVK